MGHSSTVRRVLYDPLAEQSEKATLNFEIEIF